MYLAQQTHPDIQYAVSKLSQFCVNPSKIHWQCAKYVLRYLAKTKNFALTYKASNPEIRINCDSDWAGDLDDRKSFNGIAIMIGNNLVHWRAQKQRTVSISTMEAEYIALSIGVKEAKWLQMFFKELKLQDFLSTSYVIMLQQVSNTFRQKQSGKISH